MRIVKLPVFKSFLVFDRHDYEVLLGTDVSLPLTREERLLYHDSAMTHAMVITGVSLDVIFI